MFSAVSPNKPSLCPCSVKAVQFREDDSVSSPDPSPLCWAGKCTLPPSPAGEREAHGLWVLFGLCVRALYSEALISLTSLGIVRTRISTTRMSGQRVIMGNGQSSF